MKTRDVASALGEGLFAGLVGTAAMTVVRSIEMKLRGGGESQAPADAVEHVLDLEPQGPEAERRLSHLTHWAYGTAWGGVAGLLRLAPLPRTARAALHFGLVWGTALVMLPRVDAAPPVKEWGAKEIGIDALHHAVYAAATTTAVERIAASA